MKIIVLIVFVILTLLVSVKESANILAFIPTPSISHQTPFRPLLNELARRGHQVTVITTDPEFPKGKAPNNLTEIDVHDLSYDIWSEAVYEYVKGRKDDRILTLMRFLSTKFIYILDKQMQTKEVQNIIHGKQKYDLFIFEALASGLLAFTHKFKAPVIQMSTMGLAFQNNYIIGVPTHPILYPLAFSQNVYNFTFWQKVEEIYNYYFLNKIHEEWDSNSEKVMRKHFGEDLPSMNELKNRVDMLFLNTHPIFQGNYPVPPSVQYVYGIHKIPEKELPQDLKSFMDSSKHGVIYMSFGTNTDPAKLPPETIQMFIRVFSQLPYDVLWKWSKDELPGKSDNIKIGKWFPQTDLLRHPNMKLFITQAGLQSTDEAINAAVPLVGIPMLADQWQNADKYVHFGIGKKLEVVGLTEEQFMNAVKTVISDDSYRRNIEKLKDIMLDDPLPPLERAVWWVEYVLRHGGARHLRAPAANMPWTQYYEIQLVSTLLIGLIIVLSVVIYSFYVLYGFVQQNLLINFKLKRN